MFYFVKNIPQLFSYILVFCVINVLTLQYLCANEGNINYKVNGWGNYFNLFNSIDIPDHQDGKFSIYRNKSDLVIMVGVNNYVGSVNYAHDAYLDSSEGNNARDVILNVNYVHLNIQYNHIFNKTKNNIKKNVFVNTVVPGYVVSANIYNGSATTSLEIKNKKGYIVGASGSRNSQYQGEYNINKINLNFGLNMNTHIYTNFLFSKSSYENNSINDYDNYLKYFNNIHYEANDVSAQMGYVFYFYNLQLDTFFNATYRHIKFSPLEVNYSFTHPSNNVVSVDQKNINYFFYKFGAKLGLNTIDSLANFAILPDLSVTYQINAIDNNDFTMNAEYEYNNSLKNTSINNNSGIVEHQLTFGSNVKLIISSHINILLYANYSLNMYNKNRYKYYDIDNVLRFNNIKNTHIIQYGINFGYEI